MSVQFKQGEDISIPVLVLKDGAAVDLSTCENVKAILKVNGVEQKKYSKTTEIDYGELTIEALTTNQANILVERDHSKEFPVGIATVILLASFTDATFESGYRTEEYKFTVGRVVAGEGSTEIMP
jgi:hypothetical protein